MGNNSGELKLLQINTTLNSGSTGRISEDIGLAAIAAGHESYIAAAYTNRPSKSKVICVGDDLSRKLHGIKSLLLDRHGFGSEKATMQFVKSIDKIKPDIIHLHNIHGYYLNIKVLFDYLKKIQVPVVWTFHDCWPFTGHCTFFDRVNCSKWQTECNHCPNLKGYPASLGLDQSTRNFKDKRRIFNGIKSMQIVTPSAWLSNHVKHSFLADYPVSVIHNGVDTETFSPTKSQSNILCKYELQARPIVLGVASTWDRRKGLADFIKLGSLLNADAQIVLVGLQKEQIKMLPKNIKGITRTENSEELAALYSSACVFVNPTYVDNFPTTNIEALACGTPVITYNTGGSPEAINEFTGMTIEKGNIPDLVNGIEFILGNSKNKYSKACRDLALNRFKANDRYRDYLELYKVLLNN